jgi:hypothetical protein
VWPIGNVATGNWQGREILKAKKNGFKWEIVKAWNTCEIGKAIYFDFCVKNLPRRFFTVQLSKKL